MSRRELTGVEALIMLILSHVNDGKGANQGEIIRIGDLVMCHFCQDVQTISQEWVRIHCHEIKEFIDVPVMS